MNGIFDVRDFGASGDGSRLDTEALQSAIESCVVSGGGTVRLPAGRYLSGALFLRQGVTLEIEPDATLVGSRDIDHYPIGPTRFEGRECVWPVALLNAKGLSGLRVRGGGTIDGGGAPFWERFWNERQKAVDADLPFSNRDVMRPRLIFVDSCADVRLENLNLRNSGFWHLHIFNSENVQVSGIHVQAPHGEVRAASSDGIDVDACANVVIRDCEFDTDDDCVCIKGGKGRDAQELNRPTENILVERCRFAFGHGVVTFGSEACSVRNVTVRDCLVSGENNVVRFKFRDDTPQLFENILFERIEVENGAWFFDMKSWVNRQDEVLASGLPSTVRNLVVRDVRARGMKSPGIIEGKPGSIGISNVVLENIDMATSADAADFRQSRRDAVERDTVRVSPDRLAISAVDGLSITNFRINGKEWERVDV